MIAKHYIDTPIGRLEISGSARGLRRVRKYEGSPRPTEALPAPVKQAAVQLEEYFAGKRRDFEVQFDWGEATAFNRSGWQALLTIPYGRTTSYSMIAEQVGNPSAVRAVGLANRNNPIAIIVPCHRVIAKNGQLQGYFYGLDTKRYLLQLENPLSFATQGSLF